MRFRFADCLLDVTRRELRRGAEPVHVEPQVFDLLLQLIQHRDRVVGRDELLAAVWGKRFVSDSTLNSRINAARRAIGDSGAHQQLIRTVARKGLRFVGAVREDADSSDDELLTFAAQSPGGAASPATRVIPTLQTRDRPTVAVLPFHNLSGSQEQEYFSDGVTEDIMTALARHRTLLVIARNSAFAFKGRPSDFRSIGINLGADYVVDGSVSRTGQRLRITAHLIETESGRLVWAERYDRSCEEMLDLQDEITTTIAARIEPGIGAAESQRAETKPAAALQARDLFYLGIKRFYKFTAEDNREAQRMFRSTLAQDPTLAQAYAFLSYAIVLSMLYFDVEPNERLLGEALGFARQGVAVDDQDALVRFAYGRALLVRRAYGDALSELQAAVELNPGLSVVYCGLGDSLAYEGRFDEAIPYFQRAIALSPYDPQRWAFYSYRALAHLFARQFDDAIEWAHRATRVANCHYWPFAHRVAALGHTQRTDELQVAVAELKQRKPNFCCSFARSRLFYVKEPLHLDVYLKGLQKAGIVE